MPDYFEVNDITFQYPSYPGLESRKLFDSLSFSVSKGKIAVFLALPGAGKTTLSRIITSLAPAYTGGDFSGSIKLDGIELTDRNICHIADRIGIVFQNPDEQIFCGTAEKELVFPLETRGLSPEEISERINLAFEKTGTAYLRDKDPAYLSGGEKRRLMIAVLCCTDPQLLILDETLEEIDIYGRKKILEFLKKNGKTILIFTSKMLDIYKKFADTFFIYDNGIIERFDNPTDKIFLQKAEKKGFLIDSAQPNLQELQYKFNRTWQQRPILEMKNIKFAYPDSNFKIEIDRFALTKGKTTAVIGTNGCGKSTLSKLISGLLVPDEGEILLDGKSVSADKLNKNCSYLFQNPDYQLFLPTAEEELEYGLKMQNLSKKVITEKTKKAMEIFSITTPQAPPVLMSYGQRKKLQAAVYYLLDKKIVIIDEADSGISFNDYKEIVLAFKNSPAEPAILIITHDIKLATHIADSIHFMEKGNFVDISDRLQQLLDTAEPADEKLTDRDSPQ